MVTKIILKTQKDETFQGINRCLDFPEGERNKYFISILLSSAVIAEDFEVYLLKVFSSNKY